MDIRLLGDKELERDLHRLETNMQRKLVRKAVRPAAALFAKAARKNVPVKTGALRRSIRVRAIKQRKGFFGVQARTGAGFFIGQTYYGGFIEFGTKGRVPGFKKQRAQAEELSEHLAAQREGREKRNLRVGAIPAWEFMKGAFEENEDKARQIVIDKLRELVAEALR